MYALSEEYVSKYIQFMSMPVDGMNHKVTNI